jgi:hypothetical protein
MRELRPFFLAFAALVAIPIVVDASIQQQRAQITVTITVNVTPAPLGMAPRSRAATDTSESGIVAELVMNEREAKRIGFSAQNLHFVSGDVVAQANQKPVKVEAEISPNPNGTLLTSDQSGVQISQTAGTTQTYPCLYHVAVKTTITNWSLDHGLYSNFTDSTTRATFPGSAVQNNSYLTTPHPAYTPFIVYSNGQNWALLQANALSKTYCVDLKVLVPVAASGGSYSSQATYTLLY